MRIRAGWLTALAYMFCVLAPAAALATSSGPAPCLADLLPTAAAVTEHHQAGASHVHAGGSMHDHAAMHIHHQAAAHDLPVKHHHDSNGSPGPCCAMMCVTALAADLPNIVKPIQPISGCAPEIGLDAHSQAPPLLYRPPIA